MENIANNEPRSAQARVQGLFLKHSKLVWLTIALLVVSVTSVVIWQVLRGVAVAEPDVTVRVTEVGFEPQTIRVQKKQGVTWTNTTAQPKHVSSVNEPYALNSHEPLAEGESYTAAFDTPGTYTYHDKLNPGGPTAVLIVE